MSRSPHAAGSVLVDIAIDQGGCFEDSVHDARRPHVHGPRLGLLLRGQHAHVLVMIYLTQLRIATTTPPVSTRIKPGPPAESSAAPPGSMGLENDAPRCLVGSGSTPWAMTSACPLAGGELLSGLQCLSDDAQTKAGYKAHRRERGQSVSAGLGIESSHGPCGAHVEKRGPDSGGRWIMEPQSEGVGAPVTFVFHRDSSPKVCRIK